MGMILSIPVACRSLEDLIDEAMAAIRWERPAVAFACANPHSAVVAQSDPEFMDALRSYEQVVADGVGLYLMARLAGIDVGPRITGTDYFLALMRRLDESGGGRVFFFGSSPDCLERIGQRFRWEFPRLTLCGTLSPPYSDWSDVENKRMVDDINAAKPDVLWVGMTAPKQEKWVQRNRAQLDVAVLGSIGAVFDFYAGLIVRAPDWICGLGLEWLYRLIREPRRLWRRTMVSMPLFVFAILRREVFGCRVSK